jgi:hypothetical protein
VVNLIVYTVAGSRPVRDGDYYFVYFFVSLFSGVMGEGYNNERAMNVTCIKETGSKL